MTQPAPSQHNDELPSSIPNSTDDDGFEDSDRPSKRRKLSIRHKQTTLDAHFAPAGQSANSATATATATAKPPTKVTVARPHGQLVETVNGVRAPLDVKQDELPSVKSPERLPPPPADEVPIQEKDTGKADAPAGGRTRKEERRSLRSHDDGPRLKSELATYFAEYEDVVFGTEKEDEFLTVDTALYVTDDAAKKEGVVAAPSPPKVRRRSSHGRTVSVNGAGPSTPQRPPSQQFNGCSPVDLGFYMRTLPSEPDDPLDDDHFEKSHKRAERKEKQLRNIERERAMHEKVQLDRLLDGLLGHDWLKVLGITGVTDSEAKKFEKARDYFVNEVQSLVDKFKMWKDEERRQRLEKEASRRAEESEEADEEESEEESVDPPSSELNASASRQLIQETNTAMQRSGFKLRLSKKGFTPTSSPVAALPHPPKHPPLSSSQGIPHASPFLPPSPELPITSFYSKRHLRDAALSKTRHGRNVTAFGQPIPEMEEVEFELPAEYLTEEALRANARERRRRRRETVAEGGQ